MYNGTRIYVHEVFFHKLHVQAKENQESCTNRLQVFFVNIKRPPLFLYVMNARRFVNPVSNKVCQPCVHANKMFLSIFRSNILSILNVVA